MKSETYLSAAITDEGCVKVNIHGHADELLILLEDETVSIFKGLRDGGYPYTMDVFYLFIQNIVKEVFDIDL